MADASALCRGLVHRLFDGEMTARAMVAEAERIKGRQGWLFNDLHVQPRIAIVYPARPRRGEGRRPAGVNQRHGQDY